MKNRLRSDFTQIPNELINNKHISLKAKGVYCYLSSKKDGWQFYESEIIKNSKDGKDATRSAIKELMAYGYLARYQKRKEGKFSCYEWILNPTKEDLKMCRESEGGFTHVGNTESGKSDFGKPATNNNNSIKTNNSNTNDTYVEIQRIYNEVCLSYPKIRTISDKRKKALQSFLKDFTLEDLGDVFKKSQASDFMKGKNKSGWCASFDWMINKNNALKVLEGNYDNKQKGNVMQVVSELINENNDKNW